MFHLTSQWKNSSLVNHFENGRNLLVFLVILLSSVIGGYNIAETLKMEAADSSRTSVTNCGPRGVVIQMTTILLFVRVSYIFVFNQRS